MIIAKSVRTMIVGAGDAGKTVVRELQNNASINNYPVCMVDDDEQKLGTDFHGVNVVGNTSDIINLVKSENIQEIFICMPSVNKDDVNRIYNICQQTGCVVKILPGLYQIIKGEHLLSQVRRIDITDLLGRKAVDVLTADSKNYYFNKVVMITGGGGSIGSELCRQVAKMNPRRIVVVDVYENNAYDLQQELLMEYGVHLNLNVEILSICNKPALERVFQKYHPNIVIMAAAHKHVPLMENNVIEAVENNVFGTLNTIELAEKYFVDRVHMVSTDKAVNPTSVMGATKRICEMIVQAHSAIEEHTTFSATRFGNVLGSAGSVIPIFKRQIQKGGPITITDYRIIRYFMTIPEASQLVLVSASMAKNGELFVLDMGEPVKIYDLAVKMVQLSGLEPNKDIEIVETGLRPGEKLYEELLVKTENLDKTDNSLIFIERDRPLSIQTIDYMLEQLKGAINFGSDKNMREIIKRIVPTFVEQDDANAEFKKEKQLCMQTKE